MPYRIHQNGIIECDTVEEVKELARLGIVGNGEPAPPKRQSRGRQSSAIKESWDKARKLAAKEGISVTEARSRLKKEG